MMQTFVLSPNDTPIDLSDSTPLAYPLSLTNGQTKKFEQHKSLVGLDVGIEGGKDDPSEDDYRVRKICSNKVFQTLRRG